MGRKTSASGGEVAPSSTGATGRGRRSQRQPDAAANRIRNSSTFNVCAGTSRHSLVNDSRTTPKKKQRVHAPSGEWADRQTRVRSPQVLDAGRYDQSCHRAADSRAPNPHQTHPPPLHGPGVLARPSPRAGGGEILSQGKGEGKDARTRAASPRPVGQGLSGPSPQARIAREQRHVGHVCRSSDSSEPCRISYFVAHFPWPTTLRARNRLRLAASAGQPGRPWRDRRV